MPFGRSALIILHKTTVITVSFSTGGISTGAAMVTGTPVLHKKASTTFHWLGKYVTRPPALPSQLSHDVTNRTLPSTLDLTAHHKLPQKRRPSFKGSAPAPFPASTLTSRASGAATPGKWVAPAARGTGGSTPLPQDTVTSHHSRAMTKKIRGCSPRKAASWTVGTEKRRCPPACP